jgi:hypothetical protein
MVRMALFAGGAGCPPASHSPREEPESLVPQAPRTGVHQAREGNGSQPASIGSALYFIIYRSEKPG